MPLGQLNHFGKVSFKHLKAGIPDPCIKVRKGAGRVFVENYFDPTTAFSVEVVGLIDPSSARRSKTARLGRVKQKQTVCLW